ncbi:lysylphosphatidylglycerol synthase domain-containing protein [Nostoc sp. UHCC 0302]|uniref:lysylphosphatidylglycerol synthase domain-containing protein n=1 Tax=Nostoc sp. UHCC 0302 TaxID=3134896 RepID=UPI00311CCB23
MSKQKRPINLIISLLSLLLFICAVVTIIQQLKKYNCWELINSIKAITSIHLLSALGLTTLSYLVLTLYDVLACYQIRQRLPYLKIILAAFSGHAISNSVGFAVLTGSAVRYRLYSNWGLSVVDIAQIIAFSNLSFWLGLFAIGGIGFIIEPLTIPKLLHLPFTSAHSLGWIFLALVVCYVLGSFRLKQPLKIRSWRISFPSPKFALIQLVIASADWVLAAGVLYILLIDVTDFSYPSFFSIYFLAQIAGIISHVPGGLGVFETVILWFEADNNNMATVFGILLTYRLIYYLLPLGVAILLLVLYELYQRFKLHKQQ